MKTVYVVQYLSIKGNHDEWRDTWGTPEEFAPVFTDADGMSFADRDDAIAARSAILRRNPDFPPTDWRLVKRTIMETVIDQ